MKTFSEFLDEATSPEHHHTVYGYDVKRHGAVEHDTHQHFGTDSHSAHNASQEMGQISVHVKSRKKKNGEWHHSASVAQDEPGAYTSQSRQSAKEHALNHVKTLHHFK